MSRVTLQRTGSRQFTCTDERKQIFKVDLAREFGGESAGLKPSELLPFALASCIAVTATGILEKMRLGPFELTVDVDFEHEDKPPKAFKSFDFTWSFRGQNLDLEKLKQAIETSEKKYCSVSASLKDSIRVSHRVQLKQETVGLLVNPR